MSIIQRRLVLALLIIYQITLVQSSFIENIPLYSPEDEELFDEALLETTEFIKLYGYHAENHTVYTKDDYILTMHRIPHGRNNLNITGKRKPVLLIHGVVVTSSCFVDSGNSSLGFYLADKGYDVWLGNMRGTYYSHHKKYSRKDEKFWNFCFEQMAQYDVPAMIDYVLKVTGFTKLSFIAHSMGTTVGLALFSRRPDYQEKVTGFIALSPIPSLVYAPTILRIFSSFYPENLLASFAKVVHWYDTIGLDPKYFKLEAAFCLYPNSHLCSMVFSLAAGYSTNIRNNNRDVLYANHYASGVSAKTMRHFAQMVRKLGLYTFVYDGWLTKLIADDEMPTPSKYPFNEITIPVVLFHTANDPLSDPIDVYLLARELPNLLGVELVGSPMTTHMDMIYAIDAENILYDKLLIYLQKL